MSDPEDPSDPGGRTADGTGRPPASPWRALPPAPRVPGGDPEVAVRLCREWHGLTVADLLRPDLAERLPGQVRSALRHLERGDLPAALQQLPEACAPVLPGPGHRRTEQRRARQLAGLLVLLLVGATIGLLLAFGGTPTGS